MQWTYAPAAEPRETARLRQRYRMFVDGRFTDGTGNPLIMINPATGEVLTEVSTAGHGDVGTAVRAARRGYEKVWSRMPGPERAKYLFRIARLVQERSRELAVLESLQTGMPIRQLRDVEVPAAAAHFFHHAGWADKLAYAGYGPDPRPYGVAGQIVPGSCPLLAAAGAIAPALSCGNTVVLKPAETTPLTALVLAEISQQADLPPGVLNILPGTAELGAALAARDGLDKVTFTGSVEVGRQLRRALAGTGRRLTLTLGGRAATVVFDDAPLDQAVDGIVSAAFGNSWPGSLLLVQEPIVDQLLASLRSRVAALRMGDPLDKNTNVGAIRSARLLRRIRELTDQADADGAVRWTSPAALPARGLYFSPTLFSDVGPAMRIAREEIVGPVLPVLRFHTPEEAVALANDNPAGGSASLWTEQGSRILWTAQRMRAGVVWANTVHRFDPTAPAGGYRESGPGRVGGRAGLAEYLDV